MMKLKDPKKPVSTFLKRMEVLGNNLGPYSIPDRLDLDDHNYEMAKDMGLMVAIATDARSAPDLDFMRFGVYQGRRGWLEKGDVLNTRSLREVKKLLKRK